MLIKLAWYLGNLVIVNGAARISTRMWLHNQWHCSSSQLCLLSHGTPSFSFPQADRWKEGQGHNFILFSPLSSVPIWVKVQSNQEDGRLQWGMELHFCSLLPPSLWHASSPVPLLLSTAESNSQLELWTSLTDEDKEGEQSEKARGLNRFLTEKKDPIKTVGFGPWV